MIIVTKIIKKETLKKQVFRCSFQLMKFAAQWDGKGGFLCKVANFCETRVKINVYHSHGTIMLYV